jgi:type III pantothenate kinase
MPILYSNPNEVGADRIVNAVAAYDKYKTGLIIIDFGTATTFDVITPAGEYLGGAICPGVMIASEALFRKASRLPRVEIFSAPEKVIGTDTIGSMQSGIIHGNAAMVDGMVERMRKELPHPLKVIATGGLAPLIADLSTTIETVDQSLTLEGLRIIAGEFNEKT